MEHIDLLGDDDREQLVQRVQALIRERESLAAQLKRLDPDASKGQLASGDDVVLKPTPWAADPKVKALTYQSTYFRLIDARPELVHWRPSTSNRSTPPMPMHAAAAAWPRRSHHHPAGPVAEGLQGPRRPAGPHLFNPAYFDPAKNQIVCASDLQRIGDALEAFRRDAERPWPTSRTRKGSE